MSDPTPGDTGAGEPNPYAAPTFPTTIPKPSPGPRYLAEGRTVPAGNGAAWFGGGWEIFKEAPGTWILFAVILFVGSIVVGFIPLGSLAVSLVSPVMLGGIMLGCAAIKQGEALELGHLFAGFSAKAGPLVLVGLLYLVGTIAIMVIVFVVALAGIGSSGITAMLSGDGFDSISSLGGVLFSVLFAVLLFLLLLIPLLMAFWFSVPLVVFHAVEPLAAMRASFKACLHNFVAFLVYGLIGLVLAIVACIPFMLGWLVLIPLTMTSMYAAYRDIFFEA